VLAQKNIHVLPAKAGPDYIDPMFHTVACGIPSVNLDSWAMSQELIGQVASRRLSLSHTKKETILVIEGAMGVLDGAGEEGRGSVADLAEALDLPIVMIINASQQSQSILLPPLGLSQARPQIRLAGVILNKIASNKHLLGATYQLNKHNIKLLGWLPKAQSFAIPERHLGLVTPSENLDIEKLVCGIANQMTESIDVDQILKLADAPKLVKSITNNTSLIPLGQNIAVANDQAFCFMYTHQLDAWHSAGARVNFFSPLKDEGPEEDADAVFLPGGYPELYPDLLANNTNYKNKMRLAQSRGALIYGECGGFMVLGNILEDKEGHQHPMLGLLPHTTSMKSPKLHLGYRLLQGLKDTPFAGYSFSGHEFHYSQQIKINSEFKRLFGVIDSFGNQLPDTGLAADNVCGSYSHIICQRNENE